MKIRTLRVTRLLCQAGSELIVDDRWGEMYCKRGWAERIGPAPAQKSAVPDQQPEPDAKDKPIKKTKKAISSKGDDA